MGINEFQWCFLMVRFGVFGSEMKRNGGAAKGRILPATLKILPPHLIPLHVENDHLG